jgi:hypothetical protein
MAIKIHKIGVYIQVLWYMALESHFKFCVEVLFFSFTGTQTTLNNANFVWNTYLDERKKSQIEPACNQSLNPQPKYYIKTHEEKKDGSRARSNISIDWRNKNNISWIQKWKWILKYYLWCSHVLCFINLCIRWVCEPEQTITFPKNKIRIWNHEIRKK